MREMKHPQFGHTKTGLPVHGRTIDHHKGGFNKFVATKLTNMVGTMACFWAFCVLALLSLPAVLSAFGPFTHAFPSWMIKASIIALVAWVAQTFIQLVLLPALMVGQNLQNAASDARTAKQIEDTEVIADRLDVHTAGGITAVLEEVRAGRGDLAAVLATLRSILTAPAPAAAGPVRAGAGSNPASEGLPADRPVVPPAAAKPGRDAHG